MSDLRTPKPPPPPRVSEAPPPELASAVVSAPFPIILLTAKNHPLDVVQGINAGAGHYIAKPFKMRERLDKVAHVLDPKAKK